MSGDDVLMLLCQGLFRIAGGSSKVKKLKVSWFTLIEIKRFTVFSCIYISCSWCILCKMNVWWLTWCYRLMLIHMSPSSSLKTIGRSRARVCAPYHEHGVWPHNGVWGQSTQRIWAEPLVRVAKPPWNSTPFCIITIWGIGQFVLKSLYQFLAIHKILSDVLGVWPLDLPVLETDFT